MEGHPHRRFCSDPFIFIIVAIRGFWGRLLLEHLFFCFGELLATSFIGFCFTCLATAAGVISSKSLLSVSLSSASAISEASGDTGSDGCWNVMFGGGAIIGFAVIMFGGIAII